MGEIPEAILKKRSRNKLWETKKAFKNNDYNKKLLKKRKIFKNLDKYVQEYKQQKAIQIWLNRETKNQGGFYVPADPKLAIVIRIKGVNGLNPKARKILQLLRLRKINHGTFLKLNRASINVLRRVEPYVTYGYPSLKTIRGIIYKRGFGKIGNQRIPLINNSIIEKSLGKMGIICIEDIVHEIFTVGPHFKKLIIFYGLFNYLVLLKVFYVNV